MSNSITKLLVHAKQQNKWIPRSVLTMNNFSLKAIHHLEDEGYLLGHHCNDRGALIHYACYLCKAKKTLLIRMDKQRLIKGVGHETGGYLL
ncbi:hypothetical protein MKX53_06705 [Psychrobacillus sp. FSL K6-4615]|uniref:hypothetical protein n=1 Tax=Psychrobacillus sp. FSL K6-4615 TaxID=2921551 RepID=UPI0030FB7BC4